VTHQAERNLYLPQPNYVVLYNGKVIDVTKIEYVTYAETEQAIYWKTVKSENASAEYDDGLVRFERTLQGETCITVMGRQLFTLPLFFQVFSLDSNPPLKGFLTVQAYTTFFSQTMANFEAVAEGRDVRIGHKWHALEGEPGVENQEKWPSEGLSAFVEKVGETLGQNLGAAEKVWSWPQGTPARGGGVADENGFLHFAGTTAAQGAGSTDVTDGTHARPSSDPAIPPQFGALFGEFLSGLAAALQKDWGLQAPDADEA
jgi:hypothetical protein